MMGFVKKYILEIIWSFLLVISSIGVLDDLGVISLTVDQSIWFIVFGLITSIFAVIITLKYFQ